MSGGPDGTVFESVVEEYTRLIRWIYLHPDRLQEAEGFFMPEGPAYLYLQQVTTDFVERGWRVDLGEWELIEPPVLIAGEPGRSAILNVAYGNPSGSAVFEGDQVVEVIPGFARLVFEMSLRRLDDTWKVFSDENPLAD